jgi:hypothetical protein
MIKDRVMMQEAAGKLGIKDEAIREPVQRTVLEHDKGPDGRVYASSDGSRDTAGPPSPVEKVARRVGSCAARSR